MAGKNLHAEGPACAQVLWLEGAWCLLGREGKANDGERYPEEKRSQISLVL